jgi:hypothetical protein
MQWFVVLIYPDIAIAVYCYKIMIIISYYYGSTVHLLCLGRFWVYWSYT